MTDILEKAKSQLHDEQLSIVIVSNDTYTSTKRGIVPLMDILDSNPSFLNGAAVADKVIGKAAALLMIYGGVKEVYSDIISAHALDTFTTHNVSIEYKECVEYIANRTKDGMCPMEQTVLDISDASEAYSALKLKLAEMKKG